MHKSKSHREGGTVQSFFICAAIAVLLIILLSVPASAIALSLKNPSEAIEIISLAVLVLSAAVSGFLNARLFPEQKAVFGASVALFITLLMLLTCVIACNGKVSGSAFMNYGCYFGISTLFSYLGRTGKRRRKTNHRR